MKIVIPSRNPDNLVACVQALLSKDCSIHPEDIIVVDDGARAQGEVFLKKTGIEGIEWVSGKSPFIFSRNVNIGIRHAKDDVFLMNDDAELLTNDGIENIVSVSLRNPEYGLVSAAVNNVGNTNQWFRGGDKERNQLVLLKIRPEKRMVCFVAVFIPKRTQMDVGLLDEQFIYYGFEDDDYSKRVRLAGLKIGVYDGCEFEHHHLPSTYRSQGHQPLEPGLAVYMAKWGNRD